MEEQQDKRCTLSGKPADPEYAKTGGAPQPIDPVTGMHKDYWVICAEDRAKGFVRPVRTSYKHVGTPGPKYPLADLTDEQKEIYRDYGYIKFEEYPKESGSLGRYWTQAQLDKVGKGCRTVTTMGTALSETYARNPNFYGATFCCGCGTHLPVGIDGEFVWVDDDTRVGT